MSGEVANLCVLRSRTILFNVELEKGNSTVRLESDQNCKQSFRARRLSCSAEHAIQDYD